MGKLTCLKQGSGVTSECAEESKPGGGFTPQRRGGEVTSYRGNLVSGWLLGSEEAGETHPPHFC